jgi:putative PIN family toxin of toxin-antitoxin system
LKVVIDTNILLSSLKKTSRNRSIFGALRSGKITIAVTTEILFEYLEIISSRTTEKIGQNVTQLLLNLPATERVEVAFRFTLIKSDPDDNKFVDCAVASNADIIVTNDKHFGELKHIPFPRLTVMDDETFLKLLG